MWWANIRTPEGHFLWPLNEGEEVDDNLVRAARSLVGFPAVSSWVDGQDWDIMLSQGDPHPDLLARAQVRDRAELEKVDITAYNAAMGEATKAIQVESAKQALALLDADARAQVVAEVAALPAEGVADVKPLV